MKIAKLIFVSESNHNKFYNMVEKGDQIQIEFGRVDSTPRTTSYPLHQWDKIYNEKIKKGYTDITDFAVDSSVGNTINSFDIFKGISDDIQPVLKFLIDCAKTKISNNYNISSNNVTSLMINKAQDIINQLSEQYNKKFENSEHNLDESDITEFNHLLLELYKVIPRKMERVSDYLIHIGSSKEINKILVNEQSLLDTLEGQVKNKPVIDVSTSSSLNILEEINTTIELVKDKSESDKVYSLFESNKRYIKKIYKVCNNNTESKFNPDKLNTQLLFHGSRNENWFNIIKSGLLIRPSCAVTTGSMFGNACYFANKSQKSKGYTSAPGSYWAKGGSKKYFLAVYEVAVGNQKHIYKHTHDCYSLNYDKIKKNGFDSVYAHAGNSLRNDEFMIYKTNQCTIKYLIEMEE